MRSPASMDTARPGLIYLAVNRTNGKAYVGQTTRAWTERIREHLWEARSGRYNCPFCAAIRKYGPDSFDFAVLQSGIALDLLKDAERNWVSVLGCSRPGGYNLAVAGGGGVKGKSPSQWTDPVKRAAKIAGLKAAWQRWKSDPEKLAQRKRKTSESTKLAMSRPDVRGKLIAGSWAFRPAEETTEIRKSLVDRVRSMYANPGVREKHHEAILKYHAKRKSEGLRGNRYGYRKVVSQ